MLLPSLPWHDRTPHFAFYPPILACVLSISIIAIQASRLANSLSRQAMSTICSEIIQQ